MGAFYTDLDPKCRLAGKTYYTERKFFFRHVLYEKERLRVIELVKRYNIMKKPEFENYYKVVKFFVESCKEPTGSRIWRQFYCDESDISSL